MFVRGYQMSDCKEITELFYNTVHTINAKDYTKEQLDVWATGQADLEKWNQSLQEHYSIVAIDNKIIVGFGDIDKDGYLDRLFVHSNYQGKGVAIVTELSPEDWVYDDFTTYVVTHKQKKSSDKIHFVNKNPVELIKELRKENGNGIWICGGANLIQQLVRADIIDCYYITVIPTILGSGIRLFEKADHEIKLRLLKTQSYNGMMDLIYAKR